eukprot:320665_1
MEDKAIEPQKNQMFVQLGEAITESMPQMVLQSVFLIRSVNDPHMFLSSNIGLLLFSVLASLFSIASKLVWYDKEQGRVFELAVSLKPRQECPHCVQYWYVVRVLWRFSYVLAKFVAFTLIWAVLGGAWLPMWTGIWFVFWIIVSYC